MVKPRGSLVRSAGNVQNILPVPSELIEYMVVPTIIVDADHKVRVWNKACELLTGVPSSHMLGKTDLWRPFYKAPRPCLSNLIADGRDDDIATLYSASCKFGQSEFGVSVENWCDLRFVGRRAYLAIDAGPVFDNQGKISFVVETLRDITVQKEAQDALARFAAIDGLTGLTNRRVFDEIYGKECARSAQAGSPLSLLLIDIDHFKKYNDQYGHCEGDSCLKNVAQAIKNTMLHPVDVAARFGGEEFAVVLPNTDLSGAHATAERIRLAVENLAIAHQASRTAHTVTVSIGFTSGRGPDALSLLRMADMALYVAKREGRNRSRSCGHLPDP